jgi:hypothetical protein
MLLVYILIVIAFCFGFAFCAILNAGYRADLERDVLFYQSEAKRLHEELVKRSGDCHEYFELGLKSAKDKDFMEYAEGLK